MKNIVLTTLPLLLILGCGDATTPLDDDKSIKSPTNNTKTIRALGVDFEWQAEIDTRKNWDDARNYCAQKQMRLPSPEEFFALLDTNQSIDTLFPSDIKDFWTSKAYSDTKAWKITTWSSSQSYHDKNQSLGVRCLKGETLDTHTYTKVGDTFIDKNDKTGEEKRWQDESDTSINRLTFSQAKNYCQAKDMRLPTIFELQQILKTTPTHLQKNDFLSYWSSTPLPTDSASMMTVNFTTGGVLFSDKEENNHLRCVQTIDTVPPVIQLNGLSTITLNQDDTYIEKGASAYDDVDGNLTVAISGSVDTRQVGEYTLTYSAKDKAGNHSSLTRVIQVNDVTMPIITLNGAAILTINQGEQYTDQGATAHDNTDGDLTVSISGNVNATTVGTYTLTYTATDSAGNRTQTTRKVIVLDITAPSITLNGENPTILNQHDSYNEAGASADDEVDGNLAVTISGSVDTNTAGEYTITYSTQDSAGNKASLTRTVVVKDTTKPTITLNGSAIITLNHMDTYIEKGASAIDNVDGTLTVTTTGSVDTEKVGSYTLTYSAIDSAGNSNSTTRTIIIKDITAPSITLNGSATVTLNQGDNYNELNAVATDAEDGNLPVIIEGNVDTSTVGQYIITYKAQDSAGNKASVQRTITIKDTTKPTITLYGSNPQTVRQGESYNELGASASDNVAISGSIMIDASGIDTSIPGSYTVTYTVSDTSNNQASVTRTVNIIDTTIPIITLLGANPQQIEVGASYTELGAGATDNSDGDISNSIMIDSSSVNTQMIGDYQVTYDVKDNSNNAATQALRVVAVRDTTAPIITLNGDDSVNINQGDTYDDAGAMVSDNYDSDIIILTNNPVNSSIVGEYTLTYTATDSSGNTASATRVVHVKDVTAPTIILGGDNPFTLEVNTTYNEPGATAQDGVDGDVNVTIGTLASTASIGDYNITYSATDSAANLATVTRTIHIVDTTAPVIILNGTENITLEVGSSYSDAGANASDNYDTNLSVITTGSVDTSTLGIYRLYYDVNDSSGNAAVQKMRTITVQDTTPPTLSLLGDNPITIEKGTSYTDAGATASDNYDGDISNTIMIVNPVNKDIAGTYQVTYNVDDSSGNNATQITRTVTVQDNSIATDAFTSHTVTINAKGSEWLEMVDLDKDGDLDILSASTGNNGAEVAWYENHGDYSFTEHIIAVDVNSPESIKAADMDSDGDLDILYTTYDGTGASLAQCLNDGSQTFTCSDIATAIGALSYIDIVDIDNDGNKDIISASWSNNRIDWYKNNGDGTYASPRLIDNANMTKAISLDHADFDKDGDMDIVAAANGDDRVGWYENNGSGTFTPHLASDTITGAYSVDVVDVNGDGYDDIISTSNTNGQISWITSTKTTNINRSITTLSNVYYASGVDMDNDGDIDILSNSSETGGKIAWYENTGSETNFPEHIVASGVDTVIRVFAADIDNDGNMDVVAGDSAGNVIVYENSATDVITPLPKTGDANDGGVGVDANFTRDNTTEIVTDNISGLMWSDDSSATDSIAYWSTVDSTCKNMTTGSYSDWRIPTLHELYYLLDRSQPGSNIDSTFTNIATDDGYWAYEHITFDTYSWVDFNTARSNTVSIGSQPKKHIRCVRGESFQTSFIRDDNKKVVLDHQHNLMWDDTTASSTLTNSWTDANNVCTSLNTAGYSDWRVPNINELYSIATISGVDLSFNYVFKNNQNASYWSSTKVDVNNIYTLNFGGTLDDNLIDESSNILYVRCVRNIQ